MTNESNPRLKHTERFNLLGGMVEQFLNHSDNLVQTDEVIAAEWFLLNGDGADWDRSGIRLGSLLSLRARVESRIQAAHDSQPKLFSF